MKTVSIVAGWLVVFGGVVLGLQGLLNYDLYRSLGTEASTVRIINMAIGISALLMAHKMLNTGKRK